VLAVRDLDGFEFPFDDDYPDDTRRRPRRSAPQPVGDHRCAAVRVFIGNTGNATLDAAAALSIAERPLQRDRPTFRQLYADIGRSLATDLREVARVIYGVEQGVPNVNARSSS
jgi:hypothetical protein